MSTTSERMQFADFTRTFHNLWGGTRIGMDTHALRRGCQRFYPLLSYELLAENIRAIFLSGGAELEELVMGVEFGGMFTVSTTKRAAWQFSPPLISTRRLE